MPKDVKKCGQPTEHIMWYEIGGKKFYQDRLALGQSMKLSKFIDGVSFDSLQSEEVLTELGENLGSVLEIILVPEGMTQAQHNIDLETPGKVDRGKWFLSHLTHYDLIGMFDDFLACNLDSSLINRGIQVLQKMTKNREASQETLTPNMKEFAPSLQEEIPLIDPQSLACATTK